VILIFAPHKEIIEFLRLIPGPASDGVALRHDSASILLFLFRHDNRGGIAVMQVLHAFAMNDGIWAETSYLITALPFFI